MKIITNPPKDIPKEDIYYEASKIMVTGLISATAMLGSETLNKLLTSVPILGPVMQFPIPFTGEKNDQGELVNFQTIGDALSLCITSACGAVLSTIAFFIWINGEMILK
ncbi:TPA: hypothetical protein ACXASI_001254 [Campylobacter coli]